MLDRKAVGRLISSFKLSRSPHLPRVTRKFYRYSCDPCMDISTTLQKSLPVPDSTSRVTANTKNAALISLSLPSVISFCKWERGEES